MYLKYKEHDTLQVVNKNGETRDHDSQWSPGTFG